MKKMLVLSMLLASVSSFAGTGFVPEKSDSAESHGVCSALASVKLVNFAVENGLESISLHELETIRLVDSDLRKLNPSHYSWYELDVEIKGEMKTIRTMVQKNRLTGSCN